jgi:hypothetical protein
MKKNPGLQPGIKNTLLKKANPDANRRGFAV